MNCKKCGFEIREECEFCPACGEKLENDEAVITELEAAAEADTFSDDNYTADEYDDEAVVEDIAEEDNYGDGDFGNETEASEYEPYDGTDEYDDGQSPDENIDEAAEAVSKVKSPVPRIVVSVVAIIVVALAAVAGYYEAFRPGEPNPILSIFGIKNAAESNPFIYMKSEDDMNVYYNDGTVEKLMTTLSEDHGSFTVNNDFVFGGKNVFFISDNKLSYINASTAEAVLVDEGVLPNSAVISADDKTVLYVKKDDSDNNVLYKYTLGKSSELIETLPLVKADNSYPLYGFADNTASAWYVLKEKEAETGELFLKASGAAKNVASNVFRVFYCSADGKNVVYLSRTDKVDDLYMIEKGGEPTLLATKYSEQLKPAFVSRPSKGFFHLGDITEGESGSSGTLYYRAFGKDAVAIDTNVNLYQSMSEYSSYFSNPYYDSGSVINNSANILYRRADSTILFSKDGGYGMLPSGCNYNESRPVFSTDTNSVVFTDVNDGALKYSKYTKGSWSAPVKIADKADYSQLNHDGSLIAYLIQPEAPAAENADDQASASETKLTLCLYDVKTQQTVTLTENAAGLQYFGGSDYSILYYGENPDMETYSLQLSVYDKGTQSVIDSAVSEFTVSAAGNVLVLKTNESTMSADMYTVENNTLKLISENISRINLY